MGVQFSIAKAKAELAAVVARAEKGEEIVITRHGKPVVRVTRFPETKRPALVYGDLAHLAEGYDLSFEALEMTGDDIAEFEKGLAKFNYLP
jgi:prevent-host-death family protein